MSPAGLWAQEDEDLPDEVLGATSDAPQLWADADLAWRFNPNWEIYGDTGFRTQLKDDGWVRFIVRPNVRYQWRHGIRFMGGVGVFYTNNRYQADRVEIRPWGGGRGVWPDGSWPVEHMARVEYRADYNTETWEDKTSIRLRYRIRVSHTLRQRGDKNWKVLGALEAFGTLAGEQGQFQEDSRLSLGVDRTYSPGRRLRIELVAQREDVAFGKGSVDELYLRVRWFYGH